MLEGMFEGIKPSGATFARRPRADIHSLYDLDPVFRPVYLSREDRIQAHFLICFVALTFARILDRRLGGTYSREPLKNDFAIALPLIEDFMKQVLSFAS
jgi:hypothetical protein